MIAAAAIALGRIPMAFTGGFPGACALMGAAVMVTTHISEAAVRTHMAVVGTGGITLHGAAMAILVPIMPFPGILAIRFCLLGMGFCIAVMVAMHFSFVGVVPRFLGAIVLITIYIPIVVGMMLIGGVITNRSRFALGIVAIMRAAGICASAYSQSGRHSGCTVTMM